MRKRFGALEAGLALAARVAGSVTRGLLYAFRSVLGHSNLRPLAVQLWRAVATRLGLGALAKRYGAGRVPGKGRLCAYFEEPDFRGVEEGEVRFAGWCFHPNRELLSLNLGLNGASLPSNVGLERPDVGAAFPDVPGSARSGFVVSAFLKPGRYGVTLQALSEDPRPAEFVAPTRLVVRPRPPWRRVRTRVERVVALLTPAVSKVRVRVVEGRRRVTEEAVPHHPPHARRAKWIARPVKALMVSHALDLTGAPLSQYEMTAALHARGHLDPLVVSLEDGPLRSLYEECGIEVAILPRAQGLAASLAEYEGELSTFCRQILEAGVEVVYGNTLRTFFAIDAARRMKLPSLWNIRESEPWETYFNYLPEEVARLALECFGVPNAVIFVSDASRVGFERLNGRRNFQVIQTGLDLKRWEGRLAASDRTASRKQLGVSAQELAVVLPGTIIEHKGQHDLVKALARLGSDVACRVRCFIVGDRPGPYSRALTDLVQELPPKLRHRVHLVPETRDVWRYYQAADVFVCTSRTESYPRVTLEAMACGLPIISTPVLGLSEQLVQNGNALFYPPGDVAALAVALQRLATDSALREKMGQESRVRLAGLKSFGEMLEEYSVRFREAQEKGCESSGRP